ncbi:MAG: hypothetical protein AAB858_01745 [Patescibacteria group bacterium]
MSKAGQNVFKGVNAQAWAAMSLFLQYLREPNFSYIQFEAPRFEDFNLVFSDGKKIICESKDWNRPFGFSNLKSVLSGLVKKRAALGEQDEILIACSNLDDEFASKVRATKYFEGALKEFASHKYGDKEIAMLPRVRFWRIPPELNEKIVYSLFAELIGFWLPYQDVERIAKSILVDQIYKGSAKGKTYTKENILSEVERLRKETAKKSGYFDDERVKVENQIQNLIDALDNNQSPVWAPNQLSALSSKPALIFFVLDRFKEKKIDNLEDWNDLWQLYGVYRFSFSLFKIFEDNLHTDVNKKYIIGFLRNHIGEIRRFYQHDFFNTDVVKITQKIIGDDTSFLDDAFEIVKKLLTDRSDDFFYLKVLSQSDSWEKEQIAKLLQDIYIKGDDGLKDAVVNLIFDRFNLIKDEGRFDHYAPRIVFDILKEWLSTDFEARLIALKEKLSEQYNRYYSQFSKTLKFNGFEHMGGMTSFAGHNYAVGDRHFIIYTIEPALKDYYAGASNKDSAWKFIKGQCITQTEAIKKERPDFLNRSVLTIVLERYKNEDEKISNEAFEILQEFILTRKGIPHKSELIYQAIRSNDVSDDKKWKLIQLTTDKHGYPVSVFVEQIVSQLAKTGHNAAKSELKKWLQSPKYYERSRFDLNIVQNVRTILDSDFEFAVDLFESFVNSDHFIKEYDTFETYEVSTLLYEILKRNFNRGHKILSTLSGQKQPLKNQQILLCFSLFNYRNNDESDNVEFLEKIYKKIIDPLLNGCGNDIGEIQRKLTFSQAREALAQFAGRLAIHKKYTEALRIIDIFVNDPDPYLPGKDPEDPENQYNEHKKVLGGEEPHTITSTRGWCAWVLMKCAILHGRNYIPQIIDLTEKLTKDENWYVKHMSCFALSQLAQNRLTVLPDNRDTLFFNDDQETALKMSKRVENIAFHLLNDIAGAPKNVQKAVIKSVLTVFDHIRALSEKRSFELMQTFAGFSDDAVAEAAPLFIYYAEFRKDAYKSWRFGMPGLYDDLSPNQFNDTKFKKIQKGVVDRLSPDQRFKFGAQFEKMIREGSPDFEDSEKMFEVAYRNLYYLANKGYGHQIFQVIYMAIKDGMQKKWHLNELYKLYMKCLAEEKSFYDKHLTDKNIGEMYWWPSLYNGDILESIYQQGGKTKFLNALDLVVAFPREMGIHESASILSRLDGFSKSNKRVKTIVSELFKKNPTKYYELRNKWLGKKK